MKMLKKIEQLENRSIHMTLVNARSLFTNFTSYAMIAANTVGHYDACIEKWILNPIHLKVPDILLTKIMKFTVRTLIN